MVRIVALGIADTITDLVSETHVDTHSVYLDESGTANHTVTVIQIELRGVADVVTHTIAQGSSIAETNTSVVFDVLFVPWFAFQTVTTVKVMRFVVALSVTSAVSDVSRETFLDTLFADLLIAWVTNQAVATI
jgi:hypothetical protein